MVRTLRLWLAIWIPLLLLACSGAAPRTAVAPQTAVAPAEESVRLETATGTLHGTLLLPGGRGPHPAALIIAGSGPTDRDGNSSFLSGPNNSLKYLAEGLSARGIASLRYDKRGIGQSAIPDGREEDARFDHYVDDAAGWAATLAEDPRFSTVTIVGHSEGSLIGMMAARKAGADGFVSIAGVGRPAAEILRRQLWTLPDPLFQESEQILSRLEAGQTVESVSASLAVVFRPSVQPYLISWFRHDPAEQLALLSIPVLLVQGTTDVQVEVSEAEVLKSAKPDAEYVLIEGMNHLLKEVSLEPAKQHAAFVDPSLPVVPRLVEAVSTFIQGLP